MKIPGGNHRRTVGPKAVVRSADEALDYCQYVYEATLDWYKVADAKAQLLLTLNGVFVTVLAGVVLLDPVDLAARKSAVPLFAWALLLAAAAATGLSILCAVICLYSRLSNAQIDKHKDSFLFADDSGERAYRPVVTFWFGTLSRLPKATGVGMMTKATSEFTLSAFGEEAWILSGNVLQKHRWVNRGWAAGGLALVLLLIGSVGIVLATA